MRLRRGAVLVIGTSLVAAVVLFLQFRDHDERSASPPPASPAAADLTSPSPRARSMIRVQPVEEHPLPVSEALSARIVYDEDHTDRVTAAFTGRIVRLVASPGDAVRVGSPLAEIDSPDFSLAVSDLAKARAEEERKRLARARSRELLSGGVVAQKDVESADADFMQAQAESVRAAQRVRNINPSGLRASRGNFALTSPMAGIVTERNANPAMEIGPSLVQPLFVVTDLQRLWVLIDLPERLLGQVRTGMHVSLEADAYPDATFDATIVHIAQVLDAATRRIAVRATVDNRALRLRPEMFVRATVLRDTGVGIRVPNDALVTEGLYSYVYLQADEDDYRRVRVDAVSKGAEYTYVTGALKAGDPIVTAGALLLGARQR